MGVGLLPQYLKPLWRIRTFLILVPLTGRTKKDTPADSDAQLDSLIGASLRPLANMLNEFRTILGRARLHLQEVLFFS